MGMLPEAPGRRRGRGCALHPEPHHPRDGEGVRRLCRWKNGQEAAQVHDGDLTPSGTVSAAERPPSNELKRSMTMAIEGSKSERKDGAIRYGTVGGGQGAVIGAVHRIAARLDGEFDLVAGALSSDPERAKASAAELGLDPERRHGALHGMATAEARSPDGVEAGGIVTPNHMHFAAAKAFLEAGIHVICDKPLTSTLEDARKLAALVEKSGKLFVLTHNYACYPMVRQARE